MPSFTANDRLRSLSLPRKASAANKQRVDEAQDGLEALPAVPHIGSPLKRYTAKLLHDKSTNDNMASGRKLEISGPYDVVKADLPSDLTSAIAAHRRLLPSPLTTSPSLRPVSPLTRQYNSADLDFISTEYQHSDVRGSPITTRRSPSKGRRVLTKRNDKAHNNMANETGFFSRVKDAISRSFSSSSTQSFSNAPRQTSPSYINLPEELTVVKQDEEANKLIRHYGYGDNDKSLEAKPQRRTRSVGARGKTSSSANTSTSNEDFRRHRPQTIMGNSHGAYDAFGAWATESIRAIGTDHAGADNGETARLISRNHDYQTGENTFDTGKHAHNVSASRNNDDSSHNHHHLTAASSGSTVRDPAVLRSVETATCDDCHDSFVLHTPGGSLELYPTATSGVDFVKYHYKKDDDESNIEVNKGCLCQQRAVDYLGTEVSQWADFDHSLGPVSAFSCANSPLEQHSNVMEFAEPPEWYKMSMQTKTMQDSGRPSTTISQPSQSIVNAHVDLDAPPVPSLPSGAYAMSPGPRQMPISTPSIPQIQLNRASDKSKRSSGEADIGDNSPRPNEWKKGKTWGYSGSPLPGLQSPTYCDATDSYLTAGTSNSRGVSFDVNPRDIMMRESDDSFSGLLREPISRDFNDSFNQRSAGKLKRPSRSFRKSMPMYWRPSTEMEIDDIDELSVDQPYAIGLAK